MVPRRPFLAASRDVHFLRMVEQEQAVEPWKHRPRGGFVLSLDVALCSVGLRRVGPTRSPACANRCLWPRPHERPPFGGARFGSGGRIGVPEGARLDAPGTWASRSGASSRPASRRLEQARTRIAWKNALSHAILAAGRPSGECQSKGSAMCDLRSNHSPQRQGLNAKLTDKPKPAMQIDRDDDFFAWRWSAR
jgi:hypothetical protein